MQIRLLSPDQMIDALAIAAGRAPTTGKNRDPQTAPFVTAEADADRTQFTYGIPQFLMLLNSSANANPQNIGKLTAGKKRTTPCRRCITRSCRAPPAPMN